MSRYLLKPRYLRKHHWSLTPPHRTKPSGGEGTSPVESRIAGGWWRIAGLWSKYHGCLQWPTVPSVPFPQQTTVTWAVAHTRQKNTWLLSFFLGGWWHRIPSYVGITGNHKKSIPMKQAVEWKVSFFFPPGWCRLTPVFVSRTPRGFG